MGPVSTTPLIEPDVRISRIRLSDKPSCLRPRQVTRQRGEAGQSQRVVEVLIGEPFDPLAAHLMLSAQPLAQPIVGVPIHDPIGRGYRPETEVVGPPVELPIEKLHHLFG